MLTKPLQTAVRCCLVNGTHTTGLRAYSHPPLKRLANSFSGDLPLGQQETDLPPAECDALLLPDRTIYLSSASVELLTDFPRAVYYTFQWF
ncbi:hypothetical protein TNCV_2370721 [Trichonephila clavipes]|nr:hypothetical protein TNCV_2370721 [Trichonephila clavipes]